MKSKKKTFCFNALFVFLFGIGLSLTGCSSEAIVMADSGAVSPEVAEYMEYMKKKNLSLPNMNKSLDKKGATLTRSKPASLKYDPSDIEPNWNEIQHEKYHDLEIRILPLKASTPLAGYSYTRIGGKTKAQLATAVSKLLFIKQNGKMSARVFTYIPYSKFTRIKGNSVSKLGYDLEAANYSGALIVSTVDGVIVYGQEYYEGKLIFNFYPSWRADSTDLEIETVADTTVQKVKRKQHIFVDLFSRGSLTKADTFTSGEPSEYTCSNCNKPIDECYCFMEYGCATCKRDLADCICEDAATCPRCGGPFQHCYCCTVCFDYPCSCDNSGSGSGGGSSGGGGSGGGGTSIKSPVNLLKSVKWKKQDPNKCKDACDAYLRRTELTTVGDKSCVFRSTYQDASGIHSSTHSLNTVVSVIDRHLDAGRGITVGLDYRPNSSNADGTDHFVVITGRGYDSSKGQYYYTYMDPGRSNSSQGCNTTTNRLYVDNSNNTIHYDRPIPYQGEDAECTITHIRPNDGNCIGSTTY